jgi:hypothetical protein
MEEKQEQGEERIRNADEIAAHQRESLEGGACAFCAWAGAIWPNI